MTKLERDVLFEVSKYWRREGMSPTMAELASLIKARSKATVHRVVRGLVAQGFLLPYDKNKARRLVPSKKAIDLFSAFGRNVDIQSQER